MSEKIKITVQLLRTFKHPWVCDVGINEKGEIVYIDEAIMVSDDVEITYAEFFKVVPVTHGKTYKLYVGAKEPELAEGKPGFDEDNTISIHLEEYYMVLTKNRGVYGRFGMSLEHKTLVLQTLDLMIRKSVPGIKPERLH